MYTYALVLAIVQIVVAIFLLGKVTNESTESFFEALVTLIGILGIQAPIFGRILGFW